MTITGLDILFHKKSIYLFFFYYDCQFDDIIDSELSLDSEPGDNVLLYGIRTKVQ